MEIFYPEWLANVVLVKKPNKKWWICVDFIDLNKACPKDCYPLPNIDQLVDSTVGHELYSFVDASAGYHQIPICKEDQAKIAFITDKGINCYQVMPFNLKNVGATYQRLVNIIFKDIIGRSVEVYVNDMIIKSLKAEDHARDLSQVFEVLLKHGMKLNLEKYVFGVQGGKFLGFMVLQKGIEANL